MEINVRKDKMTKWERWQALFNRQPLDRVPVFGFGFGFHTIHCGFSIADAYNNPEKIVIAVGKTTEEFGWQDLPVISYAAMGAWELGGEIKWPTESGQGPIITRKSEQVYEATKICIQKGKKCPGGFMLAPGCELPPKSPIENIWAMMQAVSDFGWYE